MAPLLLTLRLDEESQSFFDDLRRRHFPPERNHLAAHVTLFHALPGAQQERVEHDVRRVCDRAPFPVQVTGLRALGNATVYLLESPELLALRAELAAAWSDVATRQDGQRFLPHVTVQNKVDAATARALLSDLTASFEPRTATASGLLLWRYLGGPWELVRSVPFPGGSEPGPAPTIAG